MKMRARVCVCVCTQMCECMCVNACVCACSRELTPHLARRPVAADRAGFAGANLAAEARRTPKRVAAVASGARRVLAVPRAFAVLCARGEVAALVPLLARALALFLPRLQRPQVLLKQGRATRQAEGRQGDRLSNAWWRSVSFVSLASPHPPRARTGRGCGGANGAGLFPATRHPPPSTRHSPRHQTGSFLRDPGYGTAFASWPRGTICCLQAQE